MKLPTLVLFALGGFSSLVASQANTTANSTAFTVTVGLGGLVFNPRTIFAPVGSTVQFAYYPVNHSVVQSSFESPCAPLDNGIFSGYVPVSVNRSSTSFVISVNDTNPIYLYCSQARHCQAGMVAIINPSQSNSTESLEAFVANAAAAQDNVEPTFGVQGGSLIQGTANNATNNATATDTGSPTATGGGAATGSATASGTATGTESDTASATGTATDGAATASATGAASQVLAGGLLGGLGVVVGLGLGFI